MYVEFRLRSERDTTVRAGDYFLFSMTSYVISQFVQAGIFAITSSPLALDPVFDFVTTRAVFHMYGNMIQVHLIICEQFQALLPPAYMWRWRIYDVLPLWVPVTFL